MLVDCFIPQKTAFFYFDQYLECASPKRWSKYTTPHTMINKTHPVHQSVHEPTGVEDPCLVCPFLKLLLW